ncbi:MAG: hypothetical protein TQ35_0010425 [Candidatus Aramenus sulfurataquae]|uniref:Uncharacterized protein n=1 Tax=Candidatus Aramenus sulfurataquae TaxID=1326980 RepID=A0ACC6TS07_9CREN
MSWPLKNARIGRSLVCEKLGGEISRSKLEGARGLVQSLGE